MEHRAKAHALILAADALHEVGRPEAARALLAELSPEARETLEARGLINRMTRSPGVSVIMATYKGAGRILRALRSVAAQSLDPALFEILIIRNGPEDGTAAVVDDFARAHPALNIRQLLSEPAGAGRARNLGMAAARFDHMTFLDDDDLLSPDFLRELHALADGRSIIFSQIIDFDDEGEKESLVNTRLLEGFGDRARIKAAEAPGAATALTMTCIKLFPSFMGDQVQYDPDLRNGEDVVYWTEILAHFDPDLVLCPPEHRAIYYRENRQDSVSRQALSYQFNVLDRIEVAKRIKAIHDRYPLEHVRQRALAAASFMVIYLRENPQDLVRVLSALRAEGLDLGMPQYISRHFVKTLAVSFCFPPWADTAGIVAAKRLLMAGEAFDVISNSMARSRGRDPELGQIAHNMIGTHVELDIPAQTTVDVKSIVAFAKQALGHARNMNKYRAYTRLYSRAMWPASHCAAGAIKVALPDLHWVAEFSDPLVVDILAQPRAGKMDMGWLNSSGVLAAIQAAGFVPPSSDSLMEWCEFIAYALADEVLFTNANQRDYMLGQPWIAGQAARILKKSVVRPHPTLPPDYYNLVADDWRPDPGRVNLAYFGSFYQTRGLGEVLEAIAALDADSRDRLQFDIYTAPNADLLAEIYRLGVPDQVRLRPALPFFEFLARCKAYDFLLVNDAATRGIKPFNPYLPSKLSDYLGAGRAIWALVEPGSPLDLADLPIGSLRTPLGDRAAYQAVLQGMVRGRVPRETPAA